MIGWFKRVLFGQAGGVGDLPCTLQQFLYADNNYKKKCLFIEATATVQPDAILVNNLAYSGEQDDLPQLAFPIDFSMDFTSYQIVDEETVVTGFKWKNLDQDGPVKAKLVGVEFDDTQNAQLFKAAVCRAIHEAAQPGKPFDETSIVHYCEEEGLERFSEEAQKTNPLEHHFLVATSVEVPAQAWPEALPAQSNREFTPKEKILLFLENLYSLDQLLYVSAAHLFDHDTITGENRLNEQNVCFLLRRPRKGEFTIELVRDTSVFIRYPLNRNFVYHVDIEAKELMWAEEGNPPRCRLVKLADSPGQLKDQLMHSMFEISRGKTVEEALKAEEVQWMRSVNYPDLEEESKSESSEAVDCDWEVCDSEQLEDNVNSLSTQSMRYDRTFVSRGPVVSIYQEQDDNLSRLFDLPALQDLDGTPLSPEVMQLYNQDRNLLLLSQDRQFVYNVDVERGQVVDEWLAEPNMKLQDLAPSTKYGPQSDEPTFNVVSPKTVALMDPRLSESSKIAKSKTYQKNYLFSSISSSTNGGLAVGSLNGEIRLYKEAGTVAKNMFPGLGEGIISIEVSASGYWVLATTAKSLLLLPAGNAQCSGFTDRLGSLKQCPKSLTLKPQDVARYCISEINFTPAKFDNGDSRKETSIITTTGPFLIIWSLKGINKGNLYDYKIKPLEDSAIDAQFMYGRKDVVVTMPTRLQLQKPKF